MVVATQQDQVRNAVELPAGHLLIATRTIRRPRHDVALLSDDAKALGRAAARYQCGSAHRAGVAGESPENAPNRSLTAMSDSEAQAAVNWLGDDGKVAAYARVRLQGRSGWRSAVRCVTSLRAHRKGTARLVLFGSYPGPSLSIESSITTRCAPSACRDFSRKGSSRGPPTDGWPLCRRSVAPATQASMQLGAGTSSPRSRLGPLGLAPGRPWTYQRAASST